MKTLISRFRDHWFLRSFLTIVLAPGLILFPVALNANPSGAAVAVGTVNFDGMGTSNLTVNQSSQTAIINWQDFSIGTGESTTFVQPNASALAINRVVSGNPTAIYGALSANGNVMVINPNGVIVGANGMIDVNALTLSTLDASNADLLNGSGTRFQGNTGKGVSIEAGASIFARSDVVVLGNFMSNDGSIHADRTVAIGVGGDIMVNQTSDGATISVRGAAPSAATGIDNSGVIEGGDVSFDAHGNSYAMAINNRGTVRASGFGFKGGRLTLNAGPTGRTVNTGDYYARQGNGAGGQVQVAAGDVNLASGSVDASGAEGFNGGTVSVTAENVSVGSDAVISTDGLRGGSVTLDAADVLNVAGSVTSRGSLGEGGKVDAVGDVVNVAATASVDVSGFDGGSARFGGGYQGGEDDIRNSSETNAEAGAQLAADGLMGEGGQIIVWSDGDTLYEADASARALGVVGNGGFVEVSGKQQLAFLGSANTSSLNGVNGVLLLDPTDVLIGPAGTSGLTITDAALVASVLTNNVVIHTSSDGGGSGDITIGAGSDIQYDSPNSLSFFAHQNIYVDGDIKNHGTTDTAFAGTGHINLVAGWDGVGAENFSFDPTDGSGIPAGTEPNVDYAGIMSGDYGAFGQVGGSVFMNAATLEPVEVGSARGETNVFADLLLMTAGNHNGEFTQLGYRRENDIRGRAISGLGLDGDIGTADDILVNTGLDLDFDNGVTGDINVDAEGGVFLIQNQVPNNDEGMKSNDRTYVMIGHGGLRENDDDLDNRTFNEVNGGNDNFNTGDLIYLENSALGFAGIITNSATLQQGEAGAADYGSDAGNTTVGNGDNHGNITVRTGGLVQLQAARAEGHAQIGHGGMGSDDPDYDPGDAITGAGVDGRGFYAVSDRAKNSDNNARSRDVFGNMSGDITIDAGAVDLEAGRYNKAPAMIGHGGMRIRGEHTGDIAITTASGGITARAAPDSATGGPGNSNDWRWRNNRDQSSVHVGHGGFDSDFLFLDTLGAAGTAGGMAGLGIDAYDTSGNVARPDDADGVFMDARPRRTALINTRIGEQNLNNTSRPGDGIAINRVRGRYSDDAAFTVNGIDGGVSGESFGHKGDITIDSARSVTFVAATGSDAYAMVGHGGRSTHGDHVGDITVHSGGSVIFTREAWQINERGRDITNRGHRAHVQVGHGGTRYNGGSTGDVEVIARQDVKFYGGRSEAYAQVGHGGRGEDSSTWSNGRQRNEIANGTHSGDITVEATLGDIEFRSGFTDTQAYSMIGHGGYYQHADVVENRAYPGITLFGGATAADQVGHNGAITVTSGGNISFIAGQDSLLTGQSYQEMNGWDNFTMIGHGGRYSKGDHYGDIDLTSLGDLTLEARGGWDAVSIEGTDTSITEEPKLNSTDDNGRTGFRNWAQIGHGGHDSEHVNTNNSDSWNNSGMNGNGIGVLGSSDITLNVGGDLTALASQINEVIGRPMQIRILQDNGAGNPNIGNVQNTYRTEGQVVYEGSLGDPAGTQVILMAPLAVTLVADGTSTVKELVDAHNANVANIDNQIEVLAGDTSQIPSSGTGDLAFSTSVTPGQFFSQHNGRLEQVTRADGEVWNLPSPVIAAEESYVQIGHGGRATDYRGDGGAIVSEGTPVAGQGGGTAELVVDGLGHRGDIAINVGGDLRLEAGDIKQAVGTGQVLEINVLNYNSTTPNASGAATRDDGDGTGAYFVGPGIGGTAAESIGGDDSQNDAPNGIRNYAMIGLGGHQSRGDHVGNITITGDGSAANGGDLFVIAGEGREAFAQIGPGGYDSDRSNNDNQRGGDDGMSAVINITIDGAATLAGGGLQNGDTTGISGSLDGNGQVVFNDNDRVRGSYAQIGSGGVNTGGNHHSDIVFDAGGDIGLFAGNSGRGGQAQVGAGGGNANGSWQERSETLTGDITVISRTGDISMKASTPQVDTVDLAHDPANLGNIGVGRENYVMIGNGGFDTDAQGGNRNNGPGSGGFSGDIKVIAVAGSITVEGGGDSSLNADNDNFRDYFAQIGNGGAFSDGDHSGDIQVSAGTDLFVLGGVASREAYAQIGHGGYDSDGDHSGTIDVAVGNNLVMRRGASNDFNGTVVHNSWSKIGHGAQSFGGRNNNGAGNREGEIRVSIGESLITEDGFSFVRTTGEDITASADGASGPYTLLALVNPLGVGRGSVLIVSSNGATYVEDGSGNIVESGTETVVGTIDYNTGQIDITSDLTASATLTVAVNYSELNAEDTDLGPLIGHADLRNSNQGIQLGASDDTLIAVSRNDPTTGLGSVNISNGTVITSTDGGFTSDVRIYMPTAAQNNIESGAFLNNNGFDRVGNGGVGNRDGIDERVATEHFFTIDTLGPFGEPLTGYSDPPEGIFAFNSQGLYNVYYADPTSLPPVPPVPPGPAPFDIIGFLEGLFAADPYIAAYDFDSFDRFDVLFEDPEVYAEYILLLESNGIGTAAAEGEAWVGPLYSEGDASISGPELSVDEEERLRELARKSGGRSYYYYQLNENANVYSSSRLFGAPYGEFQVTDPQ